MSTFSLVSELIAGLLALSEETFATSLGGSIIVARDGGSGGVNRIVADVVQNVIATTMKITATICEEAGRDFDRTLGIRLGPVDIYNTLPVVYEFLSPALPLETILNAAQGALKNHMLFSPAAVDAVFAESGEIRREFSQSSLEPSDDYFGNVAPEDPEFANEDSLPVRDASSNASSDEPADDFYRSSQHSQSEQLDTDAESTRPIKSMVGLGQPPRFDLLLVALACNSHRRHRDVGSGPNRTRRRPIRRSRRQYPIVVD